MRSGDGPTAATTATAEEDFGDAGRGDVGAGVINELPLSTAVSADGRVESVGPLASCDGALCPSLSASLSCTAAAANVEADGSTGELGAG